MEVEDSNKVEVPANRPILRRLFALQLSFLLAFVALEIASRTLPLEAFELSTLEPAANSVGSRIKAHPYSAFSLVESWDTAKGKPRSVHHNRLGFRGKEITWDKAPGTFRIVCLGGSSTYGYTTTRDNSTYPSQLEEALRIEQPALEVEVINCGAPGYTSFESMATLATRAISLSPDVIIVYHGLNDSQAALYCSPLDPDAAAAVDNTHYRSTWSVSSPGALDSLLANSRAYMVLRRYMTDYALRQTKQDSSVVVGFVPGHATGPLAAKQSNQGFDNFERNLRTIVGISEAHGARVMLATQALDSVDRSKGARDPSGLRLAGFVRNRETVRRVANAIPSVYLADIAPRLEQLAKDRLEGGGEGIFTDTVHFTDSGAGALASMMLVDLNASGFLPPSSTPTRKPRSDSE